MCDNGGGALVRAYSKDWPVEERHWVHSFCAIWVPELTLDERNECRNVDEVDPDRWKVGGPLPVPALPVPALPGARFDLPVTVAPVCCTHT